MKTIYLESSHVGCHIEHVAKKAIAVAQENNCKCAFVFNEIEVIALPSSTPEDLVQWYFDETERNRRKYLESDEYKQACEAAKARAEKRVRDFANLVAEIPTLSEEKLRDVAIPGPQTEQELHSLIAALATRQHDYDTCVYAMSIAATAAFEYMAHVVGATGFQASCADMDILRRTRRMGDSPFAIIKGEDMIFPQYGIQRRADELKEKWKSWARDEAQKLLREHQNKEIHPDVRAHWEMLASA